MRHQRKLLSVLDELALSAETQRALASADAALSTLPTMYLGRFEAVALEPTSNPLDSDLKKLSHPLSPWIVARTLRKGPTVARSRSEIAVFERFRASVASAISADDADLFVSKLGEVCSDLCGITMTPRTKDVGTAADSTGDEIVFPSAIHVFDRLKVVHDILHRERYSSKILSAAVALVLIVNCHPFSDGNGRVSRILFNIILATKGMRAGLYVPLYEIFIASRGGYEIRLRQVELQGNWDPFVSYICDVLTFARKRA